MSGISGNSHAEQIGAARGEFVQGETRAREFGKDREKTCAGRRFEHDIVRGDGGGNAGNEAVSDRRRELLIGLGSLPSDASATEAMPPPSRACRAARRRGGAGAHAAPEFPEEEDRRRLAGVVGGLPIPRAFGVRTTERRGHRLPQHGGVNAAAASQILEQGLGGDAGRKGNSGRMGADTGAVAAATAPAGVTFMVGCPGERERANRPGALSQPDRLNPLRPSSSSAALSSGGAANAVAAIAAALMAASG